MNKAVKVVPDLYDFFQESNRIDCNKNYTIKPLLFRKRKITEEFEFENIVDWKKREKYFLGKLYKILLELYVDFLKLKGKETGLEEILDQGFSKDFILKQDVNFQVVSLPGIDLDFEVEFSNKEYFFEKKKIENFVEEEEASLGKRSQDMSRMELIEKGSRVFNSSVTGSTKAQSIADENKTSNFRDIRNLAIREMVIDEDGTLEKMREEEIDLLQTVVKFFSLIFFLRAN